MLLNKEVLWSDLFLIGLSCSHQATTLAEWSATRPRDPRASGPYPKISQATFRWPILCFCSILRADVNTPNWLRAESRFNIWYIGELFFGLKPWARILPICSVWKSDCWWQRASVTRLVVIARGLVWFVWLLKHLWAISYRLSKQMDQIEMWSFGHAVAMPISSCLPGGYEAMLWVSLGGTGRLDIAALDPTRNAMHPIWGQVWRSSSRGSKDPKGLNMFAIFAHFRSQDPLSSALQPQLQPEQEKLHDKKNMNEYDI